LTEGLQGGGALLASHMETQRLFLTVSERRSPGCLTVLVQRP